MTIGLYSFLVNGSIALLILALAGLVAVAAAGAGWWVIKRVVADIITLRGLWLGQVNGQVLAELQQKSLAVDLRHKDKLLEAEADRALMPVRRERLEMLQSLEEVAK